VDPEGLWSVTIDGYYGLGVGAVIGQDPNGKWFVSGRFGYGIGGGFSFDPKGTSPDPCTFKTGPKVASLGLFAEESLALGPIYGGVSANAGGTVNTSGEINYYGGVSPKYGITSNWFNLRGSVAGGVEGTWYFP